MRRTPYESAAAPMSHSAADPAEFNAVCRSKSNLPNRTDSNAALLPYLTHQYQLKKVSTWLKANKLSINVKKTKLMIFRPRQKTLPVTRQIVLQNNVLEQVDNTKFLGVYIDQRLDWETHVNFIAAKISKSVGLLCKAKYYLPSKSLLTLYYALIYPYLTYYNLIWASTYVTNLQRIYLLRIQKRAVRTISKADYKASSKPLFANLTILDVFSIYSFQVSSFMYLYHNNALPISFTQTFQTRSQIHQYSTRYSDLIPVEQILRNFRSCFKVLEYGIHYRSTSKMPRLLLYSSVWSNHF